MLGRCTDMNLKANTVYEFQGCLWHGHRCWITKDKSVNPINGKSLEDLFKTTEEKIDEIKDQGYDGVRGYVLCSP